MAFGCVKITLKLAQNVLFWRTQPNLKKLLKSVELKKLKINYTYYTQIFAGNTSTISEKYSLR